MTTFTIDADNNITAYAAPEQVQDGTQVFTTQKEFAKLTAEWPTARLVETWNGFAGTPGFDTLKPVKKFTDRKTAIARIWQAIQGLGAAAEKDHQDAQDATSKKGAKKAAKAAKEPKPKATKDAAATPREGSKKQIVLDLLRRKDGATLAEIAKATHWQPHSIRGFISGQLTKKMGLAVESKKNEQGERIYKIAK